MITDINISLTLCAPSYNHRKKTINGWNQFAFVFVFFHLGGFWNCRWLPDVSKKLTNCLGRRFSVTFGDERGGEEGVDGKVEEGEGGKDGEGGRGEDGEEEENERNEKIKTLVLFELPTIAIFFQMLILLQIKFSASKLRRLRERPKFLRHL